MAPVLGMHGHGHGYEIIKNVKERYGYLFVCLCVYRYLFIRYPRHGAVWCSVGRARLSIVLVNLVTLVVCIPNFVTMTLKSQPVKVNVTNPAGNLTAEVQLIWNVGFKDDTELELFVQSFNFWIQVRLLHDGQRRRDVAETM